MPLKVMGIVELRLRVIEDVRAGMSARDAAARHGASKTQVYEWLARYRVDGAKKIRAMLARSGWQPVPAVSTVHRVLVRRGLVDHRVRSREPAGGWQRFVRAQCNDLWHIDATARHLVNGRLFWVIDLVDDHSRFLLATWVCVSPSNDAGWAAVRAAVGAYGLPRQLLSDNGLNFTGRLRGITVAFERQVRAAGIELIHARPYHPETLGKLERQHATQNAWIADHGAPRSLAAAQRLLDRYRHDYNTARPHEAIAQQFPAELYTAGPGLQLPRIELAPADPYPAASLKRRVRRNGSIVYANTTLPLDTRWAGITVGLIRKRGLLEIYYGAALIETLSIGTLAEPTPRGRRPNK